MTTKNRFAYHKICANLWKPLAFISICTIAILYRWRPLGYTDNADNVNKLLVTLSYSVIGANLFYCFNKYLPSLSRNYVTKEYTQRQIQKIKEQLRLLIEVDLHPFSLGQKRISKSTYVADFESVNLYELYPLSKSMTKEELINKRINLIVKIGNELLSSYLNALTGKQLDFLDKMFKSTIVAIGLRPTFWTESNEPIVSFNDNQKEIGQSIYELYELSRGL